MKVCEVVYEVEEYDELELVDENVVNESVFEFVLGLVLVECNEEDVLLLEYL